jgi:two-component system, OmpR family, copper resistance phosphate regulon response regulator CusR
MRVLIIEDERKTASFIRSALQAEGFTADTASTGEEGLELVLANAFDTVVLDIMLPTA